MQETKAFLALVYITKFAPGENTFPLRTSDWDKCILNMKLSCEVFFFFRIVVIFRYITYKCVLYYANLIADVMVSVLVLSVVDRLFKPGQVKPKDHKIGICCSTKHAALRRKSKGKLVRNQDNVYEWGNMSICELFFQWISTMKIQGCWSSTKHSWRQTTISHSW